MHWPAADRPGLRGPRPRLRRFNYTNAPVLFGFSESIRKFSEESRRHRLLRVKQCRSSGRRRVSSTRDQRAVEGRKDMKSGT
jgi:hypothetical protein